MPRALSYLLVVFAGLIVGPVAARILWENPVAAILGLYGSALALFFLGVDALLSMEGVRAFFREAADAGKYLATFLIVVVAAAGIMMGLPLVSSGVANRVFGLGLPSLFVPVRIAEAGWLLLIPILILAAIFAILAGLEFAAAGSRWWGGLRAIILEGWRGRVGLVLLAALIASVIISLVRWEIQFLAVVLAGVGLYVTWLLLDLLFPRSRIWAVARQTLHEALHYKLVVAWVLVLLLLVFALPPAISGDGLTLKSRVQSYLQIALSVIGGGLGLLTVGLAAYTLPNEIQNKQMFLTATKPIPRWQIFVGKWVGIGVLNAALLLFSGAAVWGFTWYLQGQPTTPEDRMALEQEVLKVRHGVPLKAPTDLAARADEAIRKLRQEGALAADEAESQRAAKLEELQRNWRSIPPRGADQLYTFSGLMVDPEQQKFLHIRIKPTSPSGVDDVVFPVRWQAGDPKDINTLSNVYEQEIPSERVSIIIVPATSVNSEGTLHFRMQNLSPRDTMIFEGEESFELLYGLGTFHWNLVRALAIIWCRLAFLATFGLLFSSFLSFPVAFLATLGAFLVPTMSGFLVESLDAASINSAGKDPIWGPLQFGRVLTPLGKAVVWALPDFSKYDAVGNVVDGRLVPLMWVLISFMSLAVIWCSILGLIGCVLFTQREMAREGA